MRFRGKIIGACFLLLLVSVLVQAEEPLASKKLIQALTHEVSGERAFNYTVQISHYDRIQACEGWHDAAVMLQKELERIGYTDVEIEGWPSNGSRYYYTYRTPIGWRAKSAELWMVSPENERLCSYAEIPLTLVKHSNSADVEAELVDVGTGVGEKAYQGKDVSGKIVLATAYTGTVMREAVLKRGALGVVTWFPPEDRPGYPNMIRYTAIWPTWEEKDKIGFGFNVSKLQGWNLKNALNEGKKVVLKAKVEAEYYDGKVEILTAALPGSVEPEKEVMVIGHLCHPTPSANDNASGSGGMLEMARALKEMLDKGQIEPPKRTIRFLWVPEFAGTVPYIKAHLERMKNTLSVINCDMIGEDFHLTGGIFNIFCTPDSMPSFLNDVVVNFTRLAESLDLRSVNGSSHPFAYRVQPFSGGSDHYIFNDGALKVPSVMFNRDDIFHHTNLDTPDKVDPTELRRVCFIALGSSYYLANASEEDAKDMAGLISRNGLSRLAENYYDSLLSLERAQDPEKVHKSYAQVRNVIKHSTQRELDSVMSTLVFVDDPSVRSQIQDSLVNIKNMSASFQKDSQDRYARLCENLGVKTKKISLTEEQQKLEKIVPVRNKDFVCPLETDYVEDKLGEGAFSGIDLGSYGTYEALNFVDGKRSVLDISDALSAEFGPVDPNSVLAYFKVLEKAELLTFKK
jgi:aminopeptidase-like protein